MHRHNLDFKIYNFYRGFFKLQYFNVEFNFSSSKFCEPMRGAGLSMRPPASPRPPKKEIFEYIQAYLCIFEVF
jgi:hypothetical protein